MSAPNPPGFPSPQPQIIIQQRESMLGRYGKLVLIALIFAVMGLIGISTAYQNYFSSPGGPQEKYHSLNKTADKKIAIIRVSGTILEGDGFVKKQIDRVRDDQEIVGVVLRIDSPGGTVTGSDYLYHHLVHLVEERKLPLVVSMGSICASGGYYMAMAVGDQEDAIFAEPTTWTGSIGVVIPHYDFSGLLEQFHVKDDSIASHKNKLMGSPTRMLSDEERAEERNLLQVLVEKSFSRFKKIVRNGRPQFQQNEEALAKVTTGEIFTASQALDLGLVDKIGFLEEAIGRAAELAGHDPESLRCIKYEKPPTSLSSLLTVASKSHHQAIGHELQTLLDMSAPRAYYICTWLPSVLSNRSP
jgi:protease IV